MSIGIFAHSSSRQIKHNRKKFLKIIFSETCNCPETLQVVARPSPLDGNGRDDHETLKGIIESLILEACGRCHTYENKVTKLKSITSDDDADVTFPNVKFVEGAQPTTGSKFVAVLQVPGLVVIQRKPEKVLGAYEKVMASSVVNSWPIFAIFGVMTLVAALLIWLLVRIIYL